MALPTIATDESPESQQYQKAIADALASLGNRNQTNWFAATGALLKPTRTGSFGESAGNFATEIGQQEEQRQKEEPNIAMLRAQLAGNSLSLANKSKAMSMLANSMGMTPQETSQGLSSGTIPATKIASVDPRIFAAVSTLDKDVGETAFKMHQMSNDMIKNAIEARKANVDEAKFKAQFGYTPTDVLGVPSDTASQGTSGTNQGTQNIGGQSNLSLEARNDITKQAWLSNQKFTDTLPDKIKVANEQYNLGNQLVNAVTGNEGAFGLLKNSPGLAQTIATWFNEGLKVGNFSARLPVVETMVANLSPREQEAYQQVTSVLNQLTLNNASLLKGSVSNYEDKMVKAINGSPENTATFLKYVGEKLKAQNDFDKKTYEAYDKVSDKMLYKEFVMRSPEYKTLQNQLNTNLKDIANKSLTNMGIEPPKPSKMDELQAEMQRRANLSKGQ